MTLTISQTLKLKEPEPKRFYTPAHLLEKGMYLCFSCGHLNSTDRSYCKWCGKEKFLITETNRKTNEK